MNIWRWLLVILAIETLSLFCFLNSFFSVFVYLFICLFVFLLSLIDLRYGVLIALVELFIGGMGYLFVLPASGLNLSIRMGLFLVLLAAAIIKIFKDKKVEFFKSKFFFVYCSLFFFIILGLVTGYFRGHNPANIFFDVNAFFFLGYLLVFYQAFKTAEDLRIIWPVFWAATFWLAIKTLVVFFIFTHGFTALIPSLYQWIRDTGVGEITPAPGGFYRVFFQSQIYLVMGLILLAGQKIFVETRHCLVSTFFAVILFSAILLSFSRSFWAGLIIVLPIMFFIALFFLRKSVRHLIKSIFWTLGVVLAGFFLVLLVSYFPYPQPVAFSFTNLLGERALSVSDAAAATRWAELVPLWSAIKEHWLLGSGFGATVTFKTQDPRILSVSPTGEYTTYAFEWGWLDVWLKIGILGMLAYLFLLWKIIKLGWSNTKYFPPKADPPRAEILNTKYLTRNWLNFGLLMSLVALIITHIFTPYLNHPLGLGWVMLVGLMIDKEIE